MHGTTHPTVGNRGGQQNMLTLKCHSYPIAIINKSSHENIRVGLDWLFYLSLLELIAKDKSAPSNVTLCMEFALG